MFAAYKKFWTHYADFSGRSTRSDYWWAFLCHMIIIVPLFIIIWVSALGSIFSVAQDAAYGYEPDPSAFLAGAGFAVIFWFILLIYSLATLVPNMAIIVRRLRDAGYHWAFLFLAIGPSIAILIPVLNIIAGIVSLPCSIALIVLLCQGSKPEMVGNSYGQQNFQGQQFGQQSQQGVFQGQQFGQSQQPVQNQQFGQQPQQPVSDQSQAVEQAEPVQNPFTAETPEQSTPQDFGTQAPVEDNPFVSPIQEEQPSTPVENSVDDATENQE